MSAPRIKVLFLTRYPAQGASSRYRVFQYLPALRKLGVDAHVQPFMDEAMYGLSFRPGNTLAKMLATLRACLRRLAVLRGFRQYDIVYMQRELFPFGPPLVERYLKERGALLCFDYDDALFIKKPSRYNPLATLLRSAGKTIDLFKLVDCVIAGNNWLRDKAREHGAVAVTVEVAEDTVRIPMHAPHSNDAPVTIGWLGSRSTVKYLREIEPVLRAVAQRFPNVRFEIMGGGEFHMEGVPWKITEWSLEGELEALARFDIGLMPLPREDWANGKSGGKARTYMAAGVVPMCANIGYNRELIRDGETGYLCDTLQQWEKRMAMLVCDAPLRQRVAEAARQDIERRFSPTRQAGELVAVFERLLAGREHEQGRVQ